MRQVVQVTSDWTVLRSLSAPQSGGHPAACCGGSVRVNPQPLPWVRTEEACARPEDSREPAPAFPGCWGLTEAVGDSLMAWHPVGDTVAPTPGSTGSGAQVRLTRVSTTPRGPWVCDLPSLGVSFPSKRRSVPMPPGLGSLSVQKARASQPDTQQGLRPLSLASPCFLHT